MKLIFVTVHGFRRFKNETKMDLNGKLIAIVGANEAGKSSFLEVLQHLNNGIKFVKTGASQEISRDFNEPDDHVVVKALYQLESKDYNHISHIEDTGKIKWFTFSKAISGARFYNVDPKPERSLKHRENAIKSLEKALDALRKYEESLSEDEDEDEINLASSVGKTIESFLSTLALSDQKFPSTTIQSFRTLAEKIRSSGIGASVVSLQPLANELEEIATEESRHPADDALKILDDLRPWFLLFDEEDRNLESEYDPVGIGNEIPSALNNLLILAKLDLSKLRTYIDQQDQGQIRTLLEEANINLKKVFEDSWSQSKVYVQLDYNNSLLHVLIKEPQRSYVKIAERSDGLRQYVALLSFVTVNTDQLKPILLIDEAETHLHYDAQADLIQMLTRQTEVDQVIYTTHSIGCLPEDLGMGVRLIAADSANTSEVKNWFWVSDKQGFSPLLFGMGASTMAFMPVRYALVTEGITDAILLPSLLREAAGQDSLGFQIVSGLSETSKGNFGILENGAPSTAYLLDADKGGKELEKQLKSAGIADNRIFYLPDNSSLGLVLEDFVDKEVYLNAVNEELTLRNSNYSPIALADIPDVNRPSKVKELCKIQGIEPPSKRAVAYRILDQKTSRQIVDLARKTDLVDLYSEIDAALKLPKI